MSCVKCIQGLINTIKIQWSHSSALFILNLLPCPSPLSKLSTLCDIFLMLFSYSFDKAICRCKHYLGPDLILFLIYCKICSSLIMEGLMIEHDLEACYSLRRTLPLTIICQPPLVKETFQWSSFRNSLLLMSSLRTQAQTPLITGHTSGMDEEYHHELSLKPVPLLATTKES